MSVKKLVVLAVVLLFIAVFFALDLGQYFSLEYLKANQVRFDEFYAENPALTVLVFFLVYVAVTGLSLPGAAIMTMAAGALFGLLTGLLIVSFASSIGATLAFLFSRFLLRDSIQNRFSKQLAAINDGIERDGAFYLFTLRLVPAFPFFVINLVMGLTPIKTATFYWVSQVGMLAGTVVFVNAGTQLGQLETLSGILSPGIIASFVLLGVFPLIAKAIIGKLAARKVYQNFSRPKSFDTNMVVIGAGAGGLVSSYIAAAVKARVTLIEKHQMGGDCLNTGCVPSKALIRSAKFMSHISRAEEFGISDASARVDFSKVMARVKEVIAKIEPHDSVQRYNELGVDVEIGEAKILSPFSVEVNGRTINTRSIVIASGGRPFIPPIPGLEDSGYLTSDTIWNMETLPSRLVVLGGGPIGCELTQSFSRLGSEVVQVEMLPRIMIKEDEEISEMVKQRMIDEGVDVRTGTTAVEVVCEGEDKFLVCDSGGEQSSIPFDEILVAVGRKGNTTGFGLEELGVPLNPNGTVAVNEYLQTRFPNIYAVGDVAGPYQFTHVAAHQAWFAAVNSLFGAFKKFKADYSVIPWATFVEPEVARVGLNEQDANEAGIAYEITRYGIDDLDRAIADSEAEGFVKVLTVPGKDKILGVTIVGEHAGDLIAEFVLAMRHGLGLNKILGTIHIYPTLAESNKYAAGEWKRAHAPEKLLLWVEKFHTWLRG